MLDLRYNQVRNVDALAGLPVLRLVGLSGSPVEDITPLSGCSALRVLDLTGVPGITGEELTHTIPGPLEELRVG